MTKRRDKIQGGGVFQHAESAPQRDSEELTQQIHGQRPPDELAQVDREHEARIRSQFGAFTITATGLDLNGEPDIADWQGVGNYLFRLHGSIQWLIGDWLIYGEQLAWGDIKKIAHERGYNYGSLRQYLYVAKNLSMRIDKLSWNHHLLVAKFPAEEQQQRLKVALENNLSVKDFARWIKGKRPALPAPSPLEDDSNLKAMHDLWSWATTYDSYSDEEAEEIRATIQTVRDFLVMFEAKLPRPKKKK